MSPGQGTPDGATGTVGAGSSSDSQPSVRPPEADITDILEHLPASPQWIAAAGKPLHLQPVFWIVKVRVTVGGDLRLEPMIR